MSEKVLIDLGPIPINIAMELLDWCVKNNTDMERVSEILYNFSRVRKPDDPDFPIVIEVPAKILTLIALKHG